MNLSSKRVVGFGALVAVVAIGTFFLYREVLPFKTAHTESSTKELSSKQLTVIYSEEVSSSSGGATTTLNLYKKRNHLLQSSSRDLPRTINTRSDLLS